MNLNFNDIRTCFLQVLGNYQQITLVFLNGFYSLSKTKNKKEPLKIQFLFLTNNIKMDGIYTNQNFLHCISSFEGTSYKNLGAIVLSYLSTILLLMIHHEETRLSANRNRNPNLKWGRRGYKSAIARKFVRYSH